MSYSLVVLVFTLVNGELRSNEFHHDRPFADLATCKEAGDIAVTRFNEIPEVHGVSYFCAPLPQV